MSFEKHEQIAETSDSQETKRGEDRKYLESQFGHPEIFYFPESQEKTEVYDIIPKKQKSEIPVLIFPGWAGTPQAYKENILTQASLGRRTISINAPHGIKTQPIENYPIA